MNVDEILVAFELLDVTSKKQALDRMALSLRTKKVEAQKDSRDVTLWLDSLCGALQSILKSEGSQGSSPAAFRRLQSELWQPVEAFMSSSGLGKLTVAERTATYALLSKLLVTHARYVAQKSGAPLSVKLLSTCIGNLPGLFDGAFPGYLEAGLAPMVIRRGTLPYNIRR